MLELLAGILLIGVLVTVHEFGHFVVAKLAGVKVEVFSIGFGAPILKAQWGETEYRLAWLPVGGYVRMLGMDPTDVAEPEDIGRSLVNWAAESGAGKVNSVFLARMPACMRRRTPGR